MTSNGARIQNLNGVILPGEWTIPDIGYIEKSDESVDNKVNYLSLNKHGSVCEDSSDNKTQRQQWEKSVVDTGYFTLKNLMSRKFLTATNTSTGTVTFTTEGNLQNFLYCFFFYFNLRPVLVIKVQSDSFCTTSNV